MNPVIIYYSADGVLRFCVPNLDCGIPVLEIARKDVPAGLPFKIIDSADLPQDMTYVSAWEADMTNPDGVGVGSEAWHREQEEQNGSN